MWQWNCKRLPCNGDLERHGRRSVFFNPKRSRQMRELANAMVVGASPSTLLPLNSRIRLAHEDDNILLIRCPFFGAEQVAIRYPVQQLLFARRSQTPLTPLDPGPLLSTIQIWRNTQRYGFFDGMAATNLQNMSPAVRFASVVTIGFHVPDAEFECPMVALVQRHGGGMSLDDSCAYLQSLLLKCRRSRR